MIEVCDDLWKYYGKPGYVVCITTNACVNNDGKAAMGKGVALDARERIRGIDRALGNALKQHGNRPFWLDNRKVHTFPTKNHYKDRSPIPLVARSAEYLRKLALKYPKLTFCITRPGCGEGRLNWEKEVLPIMSKLPDNVWVMEKPIEHSSYPNSRSKAKPTTGGQIPAERNASALPGGEDAW